MPSMRAFSAEVIVALLERGLPGFDGHGHVVERPGEAGQLVNHLDIDPLVARPAAKPRSRPLAG